MHRRFERFEMNFGVAGMLVGAVAVIIGMIAGLVTFGDLAGIGFVYALGLGLVCAVCGGGSDSTFCDSANARNHWRGHLQVAATMMIVGAVGAGAGAALR